MVLKLFDGDREVSALFFEPERAGGSPHIGYVETNRDYGQRRASEALLRTMTTIYPDIRVFESRLAWVNFKVTAEKLTGKEQPLELGAEEAVENALRLENKNKSPRRSKAVPRARR